ncbi:UDP-N-acetylmuramoyl-tripeptide--D-alanyl-D-alanine ligase [Sporichthya sp.]|uniref:UDP-N-acetylmuramoyl-tripeptide--D-alanyl-D- alanine ligase n=1 Tax=Sporichthya sp. TaxID=65475 RepID=UPI001807AEE8|nr:UDP-N-acetylmuramoyl-tripeptide--D-alanyl-D-alanine ligase [Sporichthya sp.]MBA3743141.1 UDP-N-acetylmuramoyl-tripeptide--D-alanyl-D-alanine ligase [Sporichthya sp.]
MIGLSLAEIAAVTGGRVDGIDGKLLVDGPVVVDSREVVPGALFVAVPGERVDGHDFAAAAVEAGAKAVLATRPVGVPAVIVSDTVEALGELAGLVVRRLAEEADLAVVGVTGSQGKTSTKDLIASVLETHGTTIAPPGSFNNEIGLPLTALRANSLTRFLVMEMGARGIGHVRYLCDIAPPRIGVVLNVGLAHVGEFGSREAIARAKGELVEALPADGLAVLNADDPLVAAMAARTSARVLTYGLGSGAGGPDIAATDVVLDGEGRARFTLRTPDGTAEVALGLHGAHHVINSLAAAAVAHELGMRTSAIAAALSAATPRSRWRMEVTTRPDGVTVVNDAYNANPDSMRAALNALVAIAGERRSWAVLGEMRELGESSAVEHDAVGRLVADMNISRLVVVGDGARAAHAGALGARAWADAPVFVADADAAAALLTKELAPQDVVLVKASRAAGLERVAAALLEGPPVRERSEPNKHSGLTSHSAERSEVFE